MTFDFEAAVDPKWSQLATRAEAVAEEFHAGLLDSELGTLLSGTDLVAIRSRMAHTIAELARSLDAPERLVGVLVPLGRELAAHGVREEYCAPAADVLTDAVRRTLSERFSPQVEGEWRDLVGLVMAVMQRAVRGESRCRD